MKVLASVIALAGLAMGCIDTVANMQLVRIYQKDSAFFLQVSSMEGGWVVGCVWGAPQALLNTFSLLGHTPSVMPGFGFFTSLWVISACLVGLS